MIEEAHFENIPQDKLKWETPASHFLEGYEYVVRHWFRAVSDTMCPDTFYIPVHYETWEV